MVLDRLTVQEPWGDTPGFLKYEALSWHAQTYDPQAAGDKALTWTQVPWHPDYLLLPAQWLAVCQYFIYCPLKQGIAVLTCVNSRWIQIFEVLLRVSIITYQ